MKKTWLFKPTWFLVAFWFHFKAFLSHPRFFHQPFPISYLRRCFLLSSFPEFMCDLDSQLKSIPEKQEVSINTE